MNLLRAAKRASENVEELEQPHMFVPFVAASLPTHAAPLYPRTSRKPCIPT
jgi:hypothetical protein